MTLPTTLIIDADDTLWENNIHFEDATERFLDLAESRGCDRVRSRHVLVEIERKNIPVHGYGSRGFTRSLEDTLERLTGESPTESERTRIEELGRGVRLMPIQYLPGVKKTLARLRVHHRLILFTKGDYSEQSDKVARSGAVEFFHEVEVTREKRPDDYTRLVSAHAIDVRESWMVGNSPRSDVNPALVVGLGAVYIPHPQTWTLEREEVRPRVGARLKILRSFSELSDHFIE